MGDKMDDENLMYVGIGIFLLFIFLVEPYAATRSIASFLTLAGFVALIGLSGFVAILVGLWRYFTTGNALYIGVGLTFIVFSIVVSSWPMDLLFG